MAYSALQFNTNALYQAVNQTAHGFSVGEVLRFNGINFVRADNSSSVNAQIIGMVSSVVNLDQFYLTQEGFVAGLTTAPSEGGSFVPGSQYYLSAVSGQITAIKPTGTGLIVVPCFIAYTSTSGFFLDSIGEMNLGGLPVTTVISDTSMAVNNGYIVNGGTSINLLLPAVSAVGDIIEIATLATNGCVITQNAGNSVNIVDATSTVGAGGTVTLMPTGGVLSGSLRLECLTANAAWKVMSGTGNWIPA